MSTGIKKIFIFITVCSIIIDNNNLYFNSETDMDKEARINEINVPALSDLFGGSDEMEYLAESENSVVVVGPGEQKCLDEFESCRPTIRRKTKRLNVNNQLDYDLKHCSCSVTFYNCLRALPVRSQLGRVYFNHLKLRCFHYEFRPACRLYLLGSCLLHGALQCQIQLITPPLF